MIDAEHFCSFFLNHISISYITYHMLYVDIIITFEGLVGTVVSIT